MSGQSNIPDDVCLCSFPIFSISMKRGDLYIIEPFQVIYLCDTAVFPLRIIFYYISYPPDKRDPYV